MVRWNSKLVKDETEITAKQVQEIRDVIEELLDLLNKKEAAITKGFVPTDSIIYYAKTDTPSPLLWEEVGVEGTALESFNDRFTIGSSDTQLVHALYGEHFTSLKAEHNPPHHHRSGYRIDNPQTELRKWGANMTSPRNYDDNQPKIGMSGKGTPHENRPPFTVLRAFRKR